MYPDPKLIGQPSFLSGLPSRAPNLLSLQFYEELHANTKLVRVLGEVVRKLPNTEIGLPFLPLAVQDLPLIEQLTTMKLPRITSLLVATQKPWLDNLVPLEGDLVLKLHELIRAMGQYLQRFTIRSSYPHLVVMRLPRLPALVELKIEGYQPFEAFHTDQFPKLKKLEIKSQWGGHNRVTFSSCVFENVTEFKASTSPGTWSDKWHIILPNLRVLRLDGVAAQSLPIAFKFPKLVELQVTGPSYVRHENWAWGAFTAGAKNFTEDEVLTVPFPPEDDHEQLDSVPVTPKPVDYVYSFKDLKQLKVLDLGQWDISCDIETLKALAYLSRTRTLRKVTLNVRRPYLKGIPPVVDQFLRELKAYHYHVGFDRFTHYNPDWEWE